MAKKYYEPTGNKPGNPTSKNRAAGSTLVPKDPNHPQAYHPGFWAEIKKLWLEQGGFFAPHGWMKKTADEFEIPYNTFLKHMDKIREEYTDELPQKALQKANQLIDVTLDKAKAKLEKDNLSVKEISQLADTLATIAGTKRNEVKVAQINVTNQQDNMFKMTSNQEAVDLLKILKGDYKDDQKNYDRTMTPELYEKVTNRKNSGETMMSIAEDIGWPDSTLSIKYNEYHRKFQEDPEYTGIIDAEFETVLTKPRGRPKKTDYTLALHKNVATRINQGKSFETIAEEFGIPTTSLRRYYMKYKEKYGEWDDTTGEFIRIDDPDEEDS